MTSFQGSTVTTEAMAELMTILSIMRPHESRQEEKFVKHFLLDQFAHKIDGAGNVIIKIGEAPVMWSSHTDTVHRHAGLAPVIVDDKKIIRIHPKSKASCLGADDGTGVWLMLQMVRAKKPGLYIFHRGEERGGIGSRWLAKNNPDLLKGIDAAIAFDRKGTNSIITHQFGGRCCSEVFSNSLADALGLPLKSDSTGTFTDTASYTDLIGECTNLSVGYYAQHTSSEHQEIEYLIQLHDALMEFNWEDLNIKRKPGEFEPRYYGGSNYQYGRHAGNSADTTSRNSHADYYSDEQYYCGGSYWGHQGQDSPWDDYYSSDKKAWVKFSKNTEWDPNRRCYYEKPETKAVSTTTGGDGKKRAYGDDPKYTVERIVGEGQVVPETYAALVRDYPDQIAKLLEDKNYGLSYLQQEVRARGGQIKTAVTLTRESKAT